MLSQARQGIIKAARMELRVARQKVGQILITAHIHTRALVRGEISAAAVILAQHAEKTHFIHLLH